MANVSDNDLIRLSQIKGEDLPEVKELPILYRGKVMYKKEPIQLKARKDTARVIRYIAIELLKIKSAKN